MKGWFSPKGVMTHVRIAALDGAGLNVTIFPGILNKKGGRRREKNIKLYADFDIRVTEISHIGSARVQSPSLQAEVVSHPHLLSILQGSQLLSSVFLCSLIFDKGLLVKHHSTLSHILELCM